MALTSDAKLIRRGPLRVGQLPADVATLAREILVVDSSDEVSSAYRTVGLTAAGVAIEGAEAGSDCRFLKAGAEVALPVTGTLDYGDIAYVFDNEKVCPTGSLTGPSSVRLGVALEAHEALASTVWVRIDPSA